MIYWVKDEGGLIMKSYVDSMHGKVLRNLRKGKMPWVKVIYLIHARTGRFRVFDVRRKKFRNYGRQYKRAKLEQFLHRDRDEYKHLPFPQRHEPQPYIK